MKPNHAHAIFLASAFASLLPLTATADDAAPASGVSYDYAELGYIMIDSPGPSDDGLVIRGDFAFNGAFYGVGSFSDVDPTSALALGVGARTALTPSVDVFGELRFVSVDFGTGSDDGFQLSAGLRGMIAPQVELSGRLDRIDVGGSSDDSLTIGGVWYFKPDRIGAFLDYTFDDPSDALTLGVRFAF